MHQLVGTLLLTLNQKQYKKNNKKNQSPHKIHTQRADFVRFLPGNHKKTSVEYETERFISFLTSILASPGKLLLFVITGILHKLPGNTSSVKMINNWRISRKKRLSNIKKMRHSLKKQLCFGMSQWRRLIRKKFVALTARINIFSACVSGFDVLFQTKKSQWFLCSGSFSPPFIQKIASVAT